MIGALAGAALRALCAPRARVFSSALRAPEQAQRAALSRILRVSAGSAYGRSLGLRSDETIASFRAKVPIVGYDELAPWIGRQRQGERALVATKLVCYEKTSGSSMAAKHIPYTRELLGSFQSLFRIWAHDLLAHRLKPRSGRIFISVSPHFRDETAGRDATPIGLAHDSEYLGALLRMLIGRFLVVPPALPLPEEPDEFRDVLACLLAAERDLEIVSVWSPTYLLVLLEHFALRRDRLLPALSAGRVDGHSAFRFPRADRKRIRLLEREPIDWRALWPALQLVSCWASAASTGPARRLQALLPQAYLQPKGLLATEAPITLPLTAAGGCVPLVDEVLLEFADGRRERLLGELETGAEYEVIVSQRGGLLRYRLGDRVRVTGRYRSVPLLEFLGRTQAVSDLVGEKLHEDFVSARLNGLGFGDCSAVLLPVQGDSGLPHYHLLVEGTRAPDGATLDADLEQAHHYRIARQLGQLDCARASAVPDLASRLQRFFIGCGQAAGDIKDRCLISSPELAAAVYEAMLQPSSGTDAGAAGEQHRAGPAPKH